MSFYNFFEQNILDNPEILNTHEQKNYKSVANYFDMKVFFILISLVAKIKNGKIFKNLVK